MRGGGLQSWTAAILSFVIFSLNSLFPLSSFYLFCMHSGGQDGVRILQAGFLHVRALLPVRGMKERERGRKM